MRIEKIVRSARASLAGTSALLFVVALVALLPRLAVLAEPEAAFKVQKTANTAQAGAGDRLTYTIKIWATGEAVNGVWFTDTLVDELDSVSGLTATYGTLGVSNNVVTWTANLGGPVWITFSAQISPEIGSANIVNTVEVTGSGELVTSSFSTGVSPGNLVTSKSVYPQQARPGEYLTYTVRITNTGGGAVKTIWMTDDLPSGVIYQEIVTASQGSFGESNGVITWNVSLGPDGTVLLPPQEEAAITFTVQISPGWSTNVEFINMAEITGVGMLM